MRISDWSSDVCSSALLDHREEQGGDRRHAARKAQRVLGILPHAEAILEDFLIGAVEARIDQPLGAAGALAGDAFEMALAGGRAGENEGRGREDRRLSRALGQGGRSEEHTSELQSLMRNSYAVFCLEK